MFKEIDWDSELNVAPPATHKFLVFITTCTWCQNASRDCEVKMVGQECGPCKDHKYGCSHSSSLDCKVISVMRPIDYDPGDEVEGPKPVKKRKQ